MTGNILSTEEVAGLLGLSPRTVREYYSKGWIPAKQNGSKLEFEINAVSHFKQEIDAYAQVEHNIKAYFIHSASGISLESIAFEYKAPAEQIKLALEFYSLKREEILKGYTRNGTSDYLFVEEVCERLGIGDSHIIYDLIAEREIKSYTMRQGGRKKIFVSKSSFISYLGDRRTEFLYRSNVAADITGKSINLIDRIALQHKLGIKIRSDHKNSVYLFTMNEICQLQSLARID